MTVSTQTRLVNHSGNGVAVNFTYPFKITDVADIRVYLYIDSTWVLQTVTTHYTVSGIGNPGGGTVTFVTPPSAGSGNVRLLRRVQLTQLVDYITNDDFPAEVHEGALDKLTMAIQDYCQESMTADQAAGFWDALGRRIVNAGDPIGLQDVVTKAWFLSQVLTGGGDAVLDRLADPDGASVIGFVQAGANAVTRDSQSKLREIVSVKDYGAVADDVTDDAPAFNAALDALIAAGGGCLYVPSGKYRIKSKISKTIPAQQHIAIVGDGKYASMLDFSTANDLGIELISTTNAANFHPNIQIKQIGLITSRDNAGTAIKVTYADAATIDNSVNIDDVFIGQNLNRVADSGSGYGYWTRGIELHNARVSKISKLHSYGEIDKSPKSKRGIYLTGECTEMVIDNCNILEYDVGIEATGNTEGVFVTNCVVTQCRYGYRFNFSGGEPEMVLANSHANASEVCVWMTNCLQSVVSNCLFYANAYYASPGPWPEWFGVIIDGVNSSHNKIVATTFSKEVLRTGDITTGIDVKAGSLVNIDNNSFFGFPDNWLTYGIQVRSGASETLIGPGNQFQLVTAPVASVGTRTVRQPIVQSGYAIGVENGDTINFPFPFYENPVNVVACTLGTATNINVGVVLPTIIGFTVHHTNPTPTDIVWVATGY